MAVNNIVYSVTVIDLRSEAIIGFRRTPAIFNRLQDAMFAVKNNLHDISDDSTYQYAVIEKTELNVIRPNLENKSMQWWFRFNSASGEFVETVKPAAFLQQTGFGIG